MDKVHVGFDVKTGVEGYTQFKGAVEALRLKGYQVNDRNLALILASKLVEEVDDNVTGLEGALDETAKWVQTQTAEQIVAKAMEEG